MHASPRGTVDCPTASGCLLAEIPCANASLTISDAFTSVRGRASMKQIKQKKRMQFTAWDIPHRAGGRAMCRRSELHPSQERSETSTRPTPPESRAARGQVSPSHRRTLATRRERRPEGRPPTQALGRAVPRNCCIGDRGPTPSPRLGCHETRPRAVS